MTIIPKLSSNTLICSTDNDLKSVSTHKVCFNLMRTHNICVYGEITTLIPKLSSNTLLICSTDNDLKIQTDKSGQMMALTSSDCYAGINMTEHHQREDFAIWPPVQVSTVKFLNFRTPKKIAVNALKFEQSCSTIE